jgi:hypothetical protein
MAVWRVHARDQHVAMYDCVKDLERVKQAMDHAFAERHGVQQLHPTRKLPLRAQPLRAMLAGMAGVDLGGGWPAVDHGPRLSVGCVPPSAAAVCVCFAHGMRLSDALHEGQELHEAIAEDGVRDSCAGIVAVLCTPMSTRPDGRAVRWPAPLRASGRGGRPSLPSAGTARHAMRGAYDGAAGRPPAILCGRGSPQPGDVRQDLQCDA